MGPKPAGMFVMAYFCFEPAVHDAYYTTYASDGENNGYGFRPAQVKIGACGKKRNMVYIGSSTSWASKKPLIL